MTDLRLIISGYLYHWPLFFVALVITFGAAFVWLKMSKPVYEVKAVLLIKDEKKAPDQHSALQEIDLLNNSKITENELEVLKSKEIISEVVKNLELDIDYQKKDGLFYKDIYKDSPVKLTILSAPVVESETMSVVIKDYTSFLLVMPGEGPRVMPFKNPFKTSFGSFKLQPTPYLFSHKGQTIRITVNNLDAVALKYQKAIDATLPDKLATVISLSITDPIAQRGKDILNRLMFNYKQAGTFEKNRETKSTLDFIDARLASLTGELTGAEKAIEDFKSSRGLTDISSESQISLQNLQTNDTRMNEVNLQLTVISGIENYVNSSKNAGKVPTTLGISDPALTSLVGKLAELQLQRERLLATTPETNPDFQVIDNQIAATRLAIKETVASMKASVLNTRNKLQSFDSRIKSSIKNIPTQEREYISIKRQQAIKESLYTYLLQKREEVSVSYASTLTNDRIVDEAYSGPAKKPQKPLAFALALLLGFCLPATVLYRRHNGKIKDLQEIQDIVPLPVISELPYETNRQAIALSDRRITATGEQFRALRVKLKHLPAETIGGKVTLVTSSVPGEGKSFVSSNLAAALAHSGKKTVIIELDMRKPKIAETLDLPKAHAGLSDFFKGSATLANIIQKSGFDPNLDVIAGGQVIQYPIELLEKEELKTLIKRLKETYDEIIVDSPPVRLVSDAIVLAHDTDVTLYVIRQGLTQIAELSFLNELLQQEQLSNINIIFNGIQRIKYGYGYNYNQANYYGNGKSSRVGNVFSNFADRF